MLDDNFFLFTVYLQFSFQLLFDTFMQVEAFFILKRKKSSSVFYYSYNAVSLRILVSDF